MLTSVFFGPSACGAHGAVRAGQRGLFGGRRAPLSPCSSEIEFGRARPTSLLHSAVHSLIPGGSREGAAGSGGGGGGGGGKCNGGRRETDGERWRRKRDVHCAEECI